MSDLQLGLLILGLLALGSVAGYNAWRTRQSLPKTMRERPTGPRQEPRLEGAEPTLTEGAEEAESAEPPMAPEPLPVIVPEKRLGLDDLIDSIAPLIIDSPVSGDALLAALPGSRRVGSKPFAVEGLNDDSQTWEQPRAGERYSALQVGIQLANRSGPLNEIELALMGFPWEVPVTAIPKSPLNAI